MKTRHIIAIGLLSATAIGILAIGINTKKAKQTKAEYYISSYTNSNNFNLTGNSTAEYTQPNAINYYKFYYTWNINFTEYGQFSGTINLTQIDTDIAGQGQVIENNQQTYNHQTEQTNPRYWQRIELEHRGFQIINTYDLTTYVRIKFFWKNTPNAPTTLSNYKDITFTQTLISPYETITNNETITFEKANISNNINTIETYGQNQYTTGYNDAIDYIQQEIPNSYTQGYTDGKQAGYSEGWNDSDAFNHPIALQPLMLQILTMPFTFISKAFDVTLWPGTQYEFNIANFIKGLIAIATILFIIKLFTTGFAVFGNYTGSIQNHKLTKSQIEYNKAKTDLAKRTDPNTKTKINKKG